MSEIKVKLDATAIAERTGCSLRHARRLRANDDERAYAVVSARPGHAQTTQPQAQDAQQHLRYVCRKIGDAQFLAAGLNFHPEEYVNKPVHWQEILDALEGVNDAIRELEGTLGFYGEITHPDSETYHDGSETIYALAQKGAWIHRYEKPRLMAWAEKYNQPLDVHFWGYPDGMVQTDENDNEIPAPAPEHVVRKVTPAAAPIEKAD